MPLTRDALATLAAGVPDSVGPWTDRTRQAFVSLLGSGDEMVPTIEALEHVGLFSRFLPEWRDVRSLPQRNAFHTYNVDRHLLVTVANAAGLVRSVSRPDLLLVGALVHDIGKGSEGDHTEAGVKLAASIVPRMGFPPEDVAHDLLAGGTPPVAARDRLRGATSPIPGLQPMLRPPSVTSTAWSCCGR